jgi:hypothetical protein
LEGAAGRWQLLALFNWSEKPEAIPLRMTDVYLDPGKPYLAREFWSGEIRQIPPEQAQAEPVTFEAVPPHGALLLALRTARTFRPQYLGSNLHISQGLEVATWEWEPPSRLFLRLERPGLARGHIELFLPQPPLEVLHSGQPVKAAAIGPDLYRVPVAFERALDLRLVLGYGSTPTQSTAGKRNP